MTKINGSLLTTPLETRRTCPQKTSMTHVRTASSTISSSARSRLLLPRSGLTRIGWTSQHRCSYTRSSMSASSVPGASRLCQVSRGVKQNRYRLVMSGVKSILRSNIYIGQPILDQVEGYDDRSENAWGTHIQFVERKRVLAIYILAK